MGEPFGIGECIEGDQGKAESDRDNDRGGAANHGTEPTVTTLPAGTILIPITVGTQRFYVVVGRTVKLEPGETIIIELDVVCLDEGEAVPLQVFLERMAPITWIQIRT